MYINYKWNKRYDSKLDEFLRLPVETILYYKLEATFTIESDDDQMFTEDFVPVNAIVKEFKKSKSADLEINLEGWGDNPFLSIKNQDSKVRVKNSFIDFECNKVDYE
jgi:hypothetical protein